MLNMVILFNYLHLKGGSLKVLIYTILQRDYELQIMFEAIYNLTLSLFKYLISMSFSFFL